jgi:Fic family protein
MKTLDFIKRKLESIPITTSWYLSAIDEFKGKQEYYKKQSPEKLKQLETHALVESSVSSNRIEGASIARARMLTVVLGDSSLKNHEEEEVRGYLKALKWVHEDHEKIELNIDTILKFHKMIRGDNSDAGEWKEIQSNIMEKLPDGSEKISFQPPGVKDSVNFLEEAVHLWHEQIKEKRIPPLILLAAFNFDFLCIHPFRDGNGRVSRLLLVLQMYKLGLDIGRYISIERIIEENKERYYESLQLSSTGWTEGENTIWPYANYLLFVLKEAYNELEVKLEHLPVAKGAKTFLIMNVINNYIGQFSLSNIKYYLPGVGMEMIRKIIKELQKEGKIRNLGRGINARWIKT